MPLWLPSLCLYAFVAIKPLSFSADITIMDKLRIKSDSTKLCAFVPLWLKNSSVNSVAKNNSHRQRRFNSFSLFTFHFSLPSAFTLVEVLIVVAILGILAAIVVPLYEDNQQKAKESAAKENLRVLRNAIELYAAKNKGIAPGYPGNNTSAPVLEIEFYLRMLRDGYLTTKVQNPFNGLTTIKMVKNSEVFPAVATGQYGWVYKPQTKTIKLDWPNTDSQDALYFDY